MWDACVTADVKPEIDTPAKRSRLKPRRNPYWLGVSGGRGGVSLGYRKPAHGPGSWVAKIAIDGARYEERLGEADDDKCKTGALSYVAAVARALGWGRQQYAAIEARGNDPTVGEPTVSTAVEASISGSGNSAPRPASTRKAGYGYTSFPTRSFRPFDWRGYDRATSTLGGRSSPTS